VPYDDFARPNYLLSPTLTPQRVAHSLQKNAEESAIVTGYLPQSTSHSRGVPQDVQRASTRFMPKPNLNVERSRCIRKNI
jgi:D-alanyl-D-alanine dipeptidase